MAPCISPAAPVPAMARPNIKAEEVGAAADKVEPAVRDLVCVIRTEFCRQQAEVTAIYLQILL